MFSQKLTLSAQAISLFAHFNFLCYWFLWIFIMAYSQVELKGGGY